MPAVSFPSLQPELDLHLLLRNSVAHLAIGEGSSLPQGLQASTFLSRADTPTFKLSTSRRSLSFRCDLYPWAALARTALQHFPWYGSSSLFSIYKFSDFAPNPINETTQHVDQITEQPGDDDHSSQLRKTRLLGSLPSFSVRPC